MSDQKYETYQRAVLFFDSGDPAGAARLLEPLVRTEPNHISSRFLLARAYYHSAQLRRAEEQWRWVIERSPTDDYAHFALGRTLERQGRPGQALPFLRLAAAMRPVPEYADAVRRAEQAAPRRPS